MSCLILESQIGLSIGNREHIVHSMYNTTTYTSFFHTQNIWQSQVSAIKTNVIQNELCLRTSRTVVETQYVA